MSQTPFEHRQMIVECLADLKKRLDNPPKKMCVMGKDAKPKIETDIEYAFRVAKRKTDILNLMKYGARRLEDL